MIDTIFHMLLCSQKHFFLAIFNTSVTVMESDFTVIQKALTCFTPLVSFYNSWKRRKTCGFLTFSGCIEKGQWHEIG